MRDEGAMSKHGRDKHEQTWAHMLIICNSVWAHMLISLQADRLLNRQLNNKQIALQYWKRTYRYRQHIREVDVVGNHLHRRWCAEYQEGCFNTPRERRDIAGVNTLKINLRTETNINMENLCQGFRLFLRLHAYIKCSILLTLLSVVYN